MTNSATNPLHDLKQVHAALAAEMAPQGEVWQAARGRHLWRERLKLMARVNRLRETFDQHTPDAISAQTRRVMVDVEHHRQRVNDLVYDSVERDLGGSE